MTVPSRGEDGMQGSLVASSAGTRTGRSSGSTLTPTHQTPPPSSLTDDVEVAAAFGHVLATRPIGWRHDVLPSATSMDALVGFMANNQQYSEKVLQSWTPGAGHRYISCHIFSLHFRKFQNRHRCQLPGCRKCWPLRQGEMWTELWRRSCKATATGPHDTIWSASGRYSRMTSRKTSNARRLRHNATSVPS